MVDAWRTTTGWKLHRIGLIGNRAHQMLWAPIFHQRRDCRIVAAADHDADKGRALEQFGVRCQTDYDAVFDDPDVDIVSISTDFYLKRPLIRKALERGKHVLVDKPAGRTMREAREIVAAAAGSRARLLLTYPLRFQSALSQLSAAVRSGEYRNIASYSHHWVRQYPDSDLMNYVSYPTPARVNGGGELMNHGSHSVDFVHSLFGIPRRVHCRMENLYWNEYRAFGTEDIATVTCDYGTFSARIVTGRNKVPREQPTVNAVDLLCEGSWVRVEEDAYSVNGKAVAIAAQPLSPREGCIQNLIDCIASGAEPLTGAATGLAVAEITTAAYQSAQSGDWVSLPLADENHPLIAADEQVIDGLLD